MQSLRLRQPITVCVAQTETRQVVGPAYVRDAAVARAYMTSRRPKPLPAALVAERVAVQLDGFDVLGSRSIPVGTLTAMVADGSLDICMEPDVQGNMFWSSRKMASSLVVPIVLGKATPPITLEASSNGSFKVVGGSPRLTSLLAFVTGNTCIGGQHWPSAPVELDTPFSSSIRWHGKAFKQLPMQKKQEVYSYPINCVIVKPMRAERSVPAANPYVPSLTV